MSYEILEIESKNHGPLKAGFKLQIGPMVIDDWTYFENSDRAWVNPPSREYVTVDGVKKYFPHVFFPDKEVYFRFQDWAVKIIKAELARIAPSSPPPPPPLMTFSP